MNSDFRTRLDELLHMALVSGLIAVWADELHELLTGPNWRAHLDHYLTSARDEALLQIVANDAVHAGARLLPGHAALGAASL